MLTYFPKYFTNKAIVLYFVALLIVSIIFFDYMLPLQFMLFGVVAVVAFFYFSNVLTIRWQKISEKSYVRKLFITALILRSVYVIFSYYFYIAITGQVFGYSEADALIYDAIANDLATRGFDHYQSALWGMDISDHGYPTYLGVIYMIFNKSILMARLLKALASAFTCVLVYRIGKYNFGESTGRMAGIFCLLMPHFFYYCGLHLKEIEMVFLTVAFIERADYLLRNKNYNFLNIIVPILLAGSLFFFRTVLGATALMAFFTAIVFSSSKVVGWGKRILVGIWVVVAVGYFIGGKISAEVEQVWEKKDTNQKQGMEWRAQRKGGNEFAKYAGAAIFAPLIFTIPFPTMVNVDGQENQKMMNGSNYVKNITAFFTILGIFMLIYRKRWREHLLILSFMIGYLGVIALSNFAQSERFHMPSIPFALIIAAYGLSQMNNSKKIYFTIYLIFIFIAIIGWNWIKLAGRGII